MFASPSRSYEVDMVSKHAAHGAVIAAILAFVAACQDAAPPVTSPDVSPSLSAAPNEQAARAQRAAWFNRASPEVLALPATVFADDDERVGKLVFGVENRGAIIAVRSALGRLGIPSTAYEIQVVEPIRYATTLRDVFRPTQGGIQIHFGRFLCTMGFNVSHGGGRSFITNSHCTNKQGGTEGTQYWQPLSTVDPTVIATEADDPEYFRGGPCPTGRQCRFSDASRAAYSDAVASSQGVIARTTGANSGSITVNGAFTISSQDNTTTTFELRTVVNKIGRTSGWTQGEIVATCVNTNVFGSNITQLCQTFVSAGVAGGDSGSPVFQINGGRRVTLVGILWGGSGSSLYVFSPLKQIQDELGAFTATAK
jgi:hypothetical protein